MLNAIWNVLFLVVVGFLVLVILLLDGVNDRLVRLAPGALGLIISFKFGMDYYDVLEKKLADYTLDDLAIACVVVGCGVSGLFSLARALTL